MAAAAAARSFLHRSAAVPSLSATVQNPTHHLPFPHLHPLEPQPLRTKSPLQIAPLSLLHLPSLSSHHRLLSAAAAGYTETDDEDPEGPGDEDDEEEDSPLLPKSSEPLDSRRLYVGNLAFTMTPDQLAETFSQAGAVKAIEIVYDRVTNRSRGFGFVTMRNSEDASEAIRMFDGTQIGGRTAKVNFPEVPRGGEREVAGPRTRRGSGFDSPHKVYAGNLSWAVTSQSLRDTFASQPGMVGAKVVYNRDSGLSRGFGFVSFASPEEAQSAVDAMNGKEVEGRPLRLSIAVGRPAAAASQASEAGETVEELSAVEA